MQKWAWLTALLAVLLDTVAAAMLTRKRSFQKSLYIKAYILLNSFWAPYRIQHHIYVYGHCLWHTHVSVGRIRTWLPIFTYVHLYIYMCTIYYLIFYYCRIGWGFMEYGSIDWLETGGLDWRYYANYCFRLLGHTHCGHFGVDGGLVSILAYSTSALVRYCLINNNIHY